jgi:ribosomal protein L40E
MGARPLRRTIESLVVEPLANEIIRGNMSEHDEIKLGLSDGAITFKTKRVVKQDDKKEEKRVPEDKVNGKEDPPLKKEVPGKPVTPDEEPPELSDKKSEPDKNKEALEGNKCAGCGALNPVSNRWCWKCGRDLR